MTPTAPAYAFVSPPPDRIRVIRQSLRCLVFGAIGAIPIIGIVLAVLALRLFHRVTVETGEKLGPVEMNWSEICAFAMYWLIGGVFSLFYGLFNGFAGFFCVASLFLGMAVFFLWRHYVKGKPKEWNPGRRHLYVGAGLACCGCFGTILMLGLVILGIMSK
jgi:hypothetical protein